MSEPLAEAEIDRLVVENERLRAALGRAREQLEKHDFKGPKQIARALITIDEALGDREPIGGGT